MCPQDAQNGPSEPRTGVKWTRVWLVIIAALTALDVWRAIQGSGTLSESIRLTLQTDRTEGRALFLLGVAVFVRHILNKPLARR